MACDQWDADRAYIFLYETQSTNHEPVFWCSHCIHTCSLLMSQLLGRQYHCLLCYMALVDTEETSFCPFLSLNTSMGLEVVLIKKQKHHTPERSNFQARTDCKQKGVWYIAMASTICFLTSFIPSIQLLSFSYFHLLRNPESSPFFLPLPITAFLHF